MSCKYSYCSGFPWNCMGEKIFQRSSIFFEKLEKVEKIFLVVCTVFHTPHYFIEIIKGDKVVQEISLQAAVAILGSILGCLAQTCGNIPAFIIGLYPQPPGGSPLLSVLFTLPRSSCHQGSRGSDCSSSCWSWWCWWRGSCGCCGSGTNRSWWRAGQLLELCGSLCILLLLLGEHWYDDFNHGHVPRGQNKYSKIIAFRQN